MVSEITLITFNKHTSYYVNNIYLSHNLRKLTTMKLNSKVYEHRYAYWKNQLKLFWLRDLGCDSAFRIIKRVTEFGPLQVDYFSEIQLESRPLLGFVLYDIELIRTKQIEILESHFRGFLAKCNDKQLIHFINGNLFYRDVILKYCGRTGMQLSKIIVETKRSF